MTSNAEENDASDSELSITMELLGGDDEEPKAPKKPEPSSPNPPPIRRRRTPQPSKSFSHIRRPIVRSTSTGSNGSAGGSAGDKSPTPPAAAAPAVGEKSPIIGRPTPTRPMPRRAKSTDGSSMPGGVSPRRGGKKSPMRRAISTADPGHMPDGSAQLRLPSKVDRRGKMRVAAEFRSDRTLGLDLKDDLNLLLGDQSLDQSLGHSMGQSTQRNSDPNLLEDAAAAAAEGAASSHSKSPMRSPMLRGGLQRSYSQSKLKIIQNLEAENLEDLEDEEESLDAMEPTSTKSEAKSSSSLSSSVSKGDKLKRNKTDPEGVDKMATDTKSKGQKNPFVLPKRRSPKNRKPIRRSNSMGSVKMEEFDWEAEERKLDELDKGQQTAAASADAETTTKSPKKATNKTSTKVKGVYSLSDAKSSSKSSSTSTKKSGYAKLGSKLSEKLNSSISGFSSSMTGLLWTPESSDSKKKDKSKEKAKSSALSSSTRTGRTTKLALSSSTKSALDELSLSASKIKKRKKKMRESKSSDYGGRTFSAPDSVRKMSSSLSSLNYTHKASSSGSRSKRRPIPRRSKSGDSILEMREAATGMKTLSTRDQPLKKERRKKSSSLSRRGASRSKSRSQSRSNSPTSGIASRDSSHDDKSSRRRERKVKSPEIMGRESELAVDGSAMDAASYVRDTVVVEDDEKAKKKKKDKSPKAEVGRASDMAVYGPARDAAARVRDTVVVDDDEKANTKKKKDKSPKAEAGRESHMAVDGSAKDAAAKVRDAVVLDGDDDKKEKKKSKEKKKMKDRSDKKQSKMGSNSARRSTEKDDSEKDKSIRLAAEDFNTSYASFFEKQQKKTMGMQPLVSIKRSTTEVTPMERVAEKTARKGVKKRSKKRDDGDVPELSPVPKDAATSGLFGVEDKTTARGVTADPLAEKKESIAKSDNAVAIGEPSGSAAENKERPQAMEVEGEGPTDKPTYTSVTTPLTVSLVADEPLQTEKTHPELQKEERVDMEGLIKSQAKLEALSKDLSAQISHAEEIAHPEEQAELHLEEATDIDDPVASQEKLDALLMDFSRRVSQTGDIAQPEQSVGLDEPTDIDDPVASQEKLDAMLEDFSARASVIAHPEELLVDLQLDQPTDIEDPVASQEKLDAMLQDFSARASVIVHPEELADLQLDQATEIEDPVASQEKLDAMLQDFSARASVISHPEESADLQLDQATDVEDPVASQEKLDALLQNFSQQKVQTEETNTTEFTSEESDDIEDPVAAQEKLDAILNQFSASMVNFEEAWAEESDSASDDEAIDNSQPATSFGAFLDLVGPENSGEVTPRLVSDSPDDAVPPSDTKTTQTDKLVSAAKDKDKRKSFLADSSDDDDSDSDDDDDNEPVTAKKATEVVSSSKIPSAAPPAKRSSFLDDSSDDGSDSEDGGKQRAAAPAPDVAVGVENTDKKDIARDNTRPKKQMKSKSSFLDDSEDESMADSDDDSESDSDGEGWNMKRGVASCSQLPSFDYASNDFPSKRGKMDESLKEEDDESQKCDSSSGSLAFHDLLEGDESEEDSDGDSNEGGDSFDLHSSMPAIKSAGDQVGELPSFSKNKRRISIQIRPSHDSCPSLDFVQFTPKNFVEQKKEEKFDDFYELGQMLGEGEFGEVFIGYPKQGNALGEERAVKIIDKSRMYDGDYEQVINEFNLLKGLTHPNILTLYGFYEDDTNCYIVTDICKGGELWDELHERGQFAEADAAAFITHLLSAIKFLQSHKIVHRDINLENILLEESKQLDQMKIIDFGLATRYEDGVKLTDLVGKVHYVAPEVLHQSYEGSKYDVWSAGVVCYIMLAGYAPFEGDNDFLVREQVLIGDVNFNDPAWDDISDEAKDFVQVGRLKRITTNFICAGWCRTPSYTVLFCFAFLEQ